MAIFALENTAPQLPEGDNFWIADSAQVIGRVRIGQDVGIWFGAVLRGDNELIDVGAGSNVQEGCILHTDMGYPLTIGTSCTIGHNAILHGCEIGENSLIGMGAIVLNGAKIGKNCVIGAGSLVTEGKIIEDNCLAVGSPARVVRQIDDDGVSALKESARNYVVNAKRFKQNLRLLKNTTT